MGPSGKVGTPGDCSGGNGSDGNRTVFACRSDASAIVSYLSPTCPRVVTLRESSTANHVTMSASFVFNPTLQHGLVALHALAELAAWLAAAGVLAWTLRQYDRPRRFIALPETVGEPETDGDDHSEAEHDLRDAA